MYLFGIQILHDLIDEVLKYHVANIYLDLRLLKLIVEPLMLGLHYLTGKHLCKPPLPGLLEDLLVELLNRGKDHGWELSADYENLRGQASDTVGCPPHHVLLDHEEEALGVDLARVDFGLQPAHLVAPGHGLSLDAVGAELHETLIQRIEYPLIVDVHTFLSN